MRPAALPRSHRAWLHAAAHTVNHPPTPLSPTPLAAAIPPHLAQDAARGAVVYVRLKGSVTLLTGNSFSDNIESIPNCVNRPDQKGTLIGTC